MDETLKQRWALCLYQINIVFAIARKPSAYIRSNHQKEGIQNWGPLKNDKTKPNRFNKTFAPMTLNNGIAQKRTQILAINRLNIGQLQPINVTYGSEQLAGHAGIRR